MFNSSYYSAALWGHSVSGMADHHLLKVERVAASATGIRHAGRSRFISLVLGYGPRGYPAVRMIKEVCRDYF